jgi:NAD(P)-dependent dehydrogenase (short-subunit alcohol dehydrogenase family)
MLTEQDSRSSRPNAGQRLAGKQALVTGGSRGIGAAAAFLVSADASHITGSTLAADGGWML